jgi:ribosomal protein S18 acetylase RimI-like enzyme
MIDSASPSPIILPPERAPEAIDVLSDAFSEYPVMRFVIGGPESQGLPAPSRGSPEAEEYDQSLRALVTFFVMARVLRKEPILALAGQGDAGLVGVATLTLPVSGPTPEALDAYRTRAWMQGGDDARARYEALGVIWQEFAIDEPHYHLNMIGVPRTHAGQGLGRVLLDEVHRISREDPGSSGVSLTTEDPRNVELYRHVGYEVVGEGHVPGGIRTWAMFRPD